MNNPKFQSGEIVFVAPTRMAATPGGLYRIVCALPAGGGQTRYRVKGDHEAYERVIEERVMQPPAVMQTPPMQAPAA